MKICKLCNKQYECDDECNKNCDKDCVMNQICGDCYSQHAYLIFMG
jgi:hypothetical protein